MGIAPRTLDFMMIRAIRWQEVPFTTLTSVPGQALVDFFGMVDGIVIQDHMGCLGIRMVFVS